MAQQIGIDFVRWMLLAGGGLAIDRIDPIRLISVATCLRPTRSPSRVSIQLNIRAPANG